MIGLATAGDSPFLRPLRMIKRRLEGPECGPIPMLQAKP